MNLQRVWKGVAWWPLLFFFVLGSGLAVWGSTPFVHRVTVDAVSPLSPVQVLRLTVRDDTPVSHGPPDLYPDRQVSIRLLLQNQATRELIGTVIVVRIYAVSGRLIREMVTRRPQLAAQETFQIELPLIRGYRVSDLRVQVVVEYDA